MKPAWLIACIISINLLLAAIVGLLVGKTDPAGIAWFISFTASAILHLVIGLFILNIAGQITTWSKGFLASSWICALVASGLIFIPLLVS
jgi:hypothetical protein